MASQRSPTRLPMTSSSRWAAFLLHRAVQACQYSVSMANLERALQKALRKPKSIKKLFKRRQGGNVNARNKDGNSPLLLACSLLLKASRG